MADIVSALYSLVTSDADVSADVSTRFYPNRAPQNPTLPFIRLQRISEVNETQHDGPGSMDEGRFQFDIYAETHIVADRILRNLKDLLDGYSGTVSGVDIEAVFFENATEDYEEKTFDHRIMADFMVHWQR